jgi:hypothetical protein
MSLVIYLVPPSGDYAFVFVFYVMHIISSLSEKKGACSLGRRRAGLVTRYYRDTRLSCFGSKSYKEEAVA